MIKLACMTWVYSHVSFENALERIAKAGFKYVSFGLPHEENPVFSENKPDEATHTLRLLDRYGLQPVTLVSTEQLSPNQTIERACRWMDFARELGVKELLSLGTWSYRRFPDERHSEKEMTILNKAFAEKFHILAEEAAKRDLVISIKPHTGNTATADELNQTLSAIGSPFVKVNYDPGNVRYYEGINPTADLRLIAKQVISFIAKDHKGGRFESDFPIPGEGDVDFPALFAILNEMQFKGPIIVERIDGRGEPRTLEELDERNAMAYKNLLKMLVEAGFEK